MKILYVTEQIYLHGGAEKILIQKLNYWADVFGYDVLLVTSEQKGKPVFFPLSEKVKHIDLNIGYAKGSYFSIQNIKKFPKHYNALQSEIKKFNPDAIFLISLTWIRFILPILARGYAVYNEYHTSYYGFFLGYQKLPIFKKVIKKISYGMIRLAESFYTNIIFLNQEEFHHYNRKNGLIIPNFFDEINEIKALPKQKQAITLGRLSYQKGYDLLIDAWEIADKSVSGWTLEIYGNGENHDQLERQIKSKSLRNPIHLNEATNSVNEKLSESAFYVMSSRFETFPMVLLEAMSNSLPVVSFECPSGPASMLENNIDSFLVQKNDVNALAERMVYLMENESLRIQMGESGLRNVKRFSPQIIMSQWDALVKLNTKK